MCGCLTLCDTIEQKVGDYLALGYTFIYWAKKSDKTRYKQLDKVTFFFQKNPEIFNRFKIFF